MRKLASIQRIRALAPIEGADAIEKAAVLGWQLPRSCAIVSRIIIYRFFHQLPHFQATVSPAGPTM
jgi:hypothetical protein